MPLTLNGESTETAGQNLSVGENGAGSGELDGGTQLNFNSDAFDNVNIGIGADGDGDFTVTGAETELSTSGINNTVQVGRELGTGSLTVEAGGGVNTLQLEAGRGGTGTITITGADTEALVDPTGGTFETGFEDGGGFVRAGRDLDSDSDGTFDQEGDGTIEVLDGGLLRISDDANTVEAGLQIGRDGADGSVRVSGEGSRIEVQAIDELDAEDRFRGTFVQVGHSGGGSDEAAAELIIENDGVMELTGTRGGVQVGREADGVLIVRNGGELNVLGDGVENNDLRLGRIDGVLGQVTVTGEGSEINVENESFIEVGGAGQGTLRIEDGADVDFDGGDETVNVTIARDATGSGALIVDGENTTLTMASDFAATDDAASVFITLGRGGDGSFEITGGADVDLEGEETGMNIGRDAGASGALIVDGAGSTLSFSGEDLNDTGRGSAFVTIGRGGDGAVEVTNGAVFDLTGDGADVGMQLGRDAGASGALTVDGEGSTLSLSAGDAAGGFVFVTITVGRDGDGAFDVTGGADVTLSITGEADDSSGGVIVGGNEGATGSWLVDGVGTTVVIDTPNNVGSHEITIGRSGDGDATFSDGARVELRGEDTRTLIGQDSTSTGDLDVLSGAFFDAGNALDVGFLFDTENSGDGTLTISEAEVSVGDGGTVVGATGRLDGADGTLTSDLNVAGGTVDVGDAGGNGELTVAGEVTFDGGALLLDVDGAGASGYDQFSVTGAANFTNNSTVTIDLTGATLTTGDQLSLIDADGGLTLDQSAVQIVGAGDNSVSFDFVDGELVLTVDEGNTPRGLVGPGDAVGDFNGDGTDDFAWRNTDDGAVALWLMDDGAPSFQGPGAVSEEWVSEATGDFRGGAPDDILWRNTDTDAVVVWELGGVGPAFRQIGSASSEWSVEGGGAFSGGPADDILWRNENSGDVVLWEMSGVGPNFERLGSATADWSIEGTGDFNGDSTDDVLWRNATTNEVVIWELGGPRVTFETAGSAISEWSVQGTGDFNGDGTDDIAWRNSTTGDVAIWEMDGSRAESFARPGTATFDWSVIGTGDFNGDEVDDILWRNETSGEVVNWALGDGAPSFERAGNAGDDWEIVTWNPDDPSV